MSSSWRTWAWAAILAAACAEAPAPDATSPGSAAAAAGGEGAPARPPPSAGAPEIATIPGEWSQVKRRSGAWTFAAGCAPAPDLRITPTALTAGACTGTVSTSHTEGDTLMIDLVDAAGAEARATLRWTDRAAGVGQVTWSGCFAAATPFMDTEHAAALAPPPGCAAP